RALLADLRQALARALLGFLGAPLVDLGRLLAGLGDDAHDVLADLAEALGDEKELFRSALAVAQHADVDGREHGRVLGQHAERPVHAGQAHRVDALVQHDAVRRDDQQGQLASHAGFTPWPRAWPRQSWRLPRPWRPRLAWCPRAP